MRTTQSSRIGWAIMSLRPEDLNDMSGMHALVTGAGTGIGLMIAKTYAMHGATVYLVGRREDKLKAAEIEIDLLKAPGRSVILPGDVSTKVGIERLKESYCSASHQDHLDVLVANAGIFRAETKKWDAALSVADLSAQMTSSSFDDWTESCAINTASPYHLTGSFLPLLAKAEHGNVIITSSIAGLHHSKISSNPSYSASKAAVNHLVRIMANRVARFYIRVNAICPGIFPSEMNRPESGAFTSVLERMPAKRYGTEAEMGITAVFLAKCTYIDGQLIALDGGRSLTANGD